MQLGLKSVRRLAHQPLAVLGVLLLVALGCVRGLRALAFSS